MARNKEKISKKPSSRNKAERNKLRQIPGEGQKAPARVTRRNPLTGPYARPSAPNQHDPDLSLQSLGESMAQGSTRGNLSVPRDYRYDPKGQNYPFKRDARDYPRKQD